MSKQAQAELILKLYELRTDEKLRAARHWYTTHFNPKSAQEIAVLMASGHLASAHYRMVTTYWDMACAFVLFEAIDESFFHKTQTEYLAVFAKIDPFIGELRQLFGLPDYLESLEKVARTAPNAEEYFVKIRGLMSRWAEAEKSEK
ncbi:MAG: hypothetical protein M3209_20995 [Acidobacteriota bacterium]|nr:hypothetical protein [Acidobacteriota bacterium]